MSKMRHIITCFLCVWLGLILLVFLNEVLELFPFVLENDFSLFIYCLFTPFLMIIPSTIAYLLNKNNKNIKNLFLGFFFLSIAYYLYWGIFLAYSYMRVESILSNESFVKFKKIHKGAEPGGYVYSYNDFDDGYYSIDIPHETDALKFYRLNLYNKSMAMEVILYKRIDEMFLEVKRLKLDKLKTQILLKDGLDKKLFEPLNNIDMKK